MPSSLLRELQSSLLDVHTHLRYCYDWSWWSWWSRRSHNTVPILSWFTLFQKHCMWRTHILSATFHIGFSKRIKSTQSHPRSWVTLLPFWTLQVIKKMSINDLKGEIVKFALLCFTKSTAVNCMYRMINPQLSQNTHGANWFQLRSSEDLMFKSISQNF